MELHDLASRLTDLVATAANTKLKFVRLKDGLIVGPRAALIVMLEDRSGAIVTKLNGTRLHAISLIVQKTTRSKLDWLNNGSAYGVGAKLHSAFDSVFVELTEAEAEALRPPKMPLSGASLPLAAAVVPQA
jgi:hypothetical protein